MNKSKKPKVSASKAIKQAQAKDKKQDAKNIKALKKKLSK